MIDDNPANILNTKATAIVYNQPWNEHLFGYPRMFNWYDIAQYFTKEKEKETL